MNNEASPAPLPEWPAHPRRSRIRGVIWKIAGVLSLAMILLWPVVFLAAGWMEPGDIDDIPPGWPMFIFGLIGVKCYMRGKRHFAIAATELLAKDPRPPVIYLRSFQHDKKSAGSAAGSRFWGGLAALFDLKTVEERLAEALTPIGPVVAIGKPGEKLPALGAARLYVGDDEWQDAIRTLMERAKLVVLLLGDTPGFWWELERSVKDLPPERLVLLVPFRKKRYDAFREQAAAHFPHPLPEYSARSWWLIPLVLMGLAAAAAWPFGPESMFAAAVWAGLLSLLFRPRRGLGKLAGLIYFRSDWTPEWVDLTTIKPAKGFRLNFYGHNRMKQSLGWNLRPVFAQLGLEWAPPKTRRGYLALGAVAASILILSAAGFVSMFVSERRVRSEREAPRDAFIERVRQDPEIVRKFGSLSRTDADVQARLLARRGILRLGDAEVIERQRIIGETWVTRASGCAGALMEGADPLTDDQVLYETQAVVQRWYRIMGDAAIAETRDAPRRTPSADEIRAAFEHIWPDHGALVPNDMLWLVRQNTKSAAVRSFLEVLPIYDPFTGFVQGSEAEVCRAFGELNRKASTLPAPHNAVLARALAASMW